jgi:cell filamentation protein
VTFDPFNDFATRGYLRNFEGEKDLAKIKLVEHASFLAKLDTALDQLARIDRLSYQDILDTHRTLFKDVYPWAGQDRAQTAPDKVISKGGVIFAHPDDVKRAVDYALRMGQDKALMAEKPGEVMGYLAYAHPFLDGNGRTILAAHVELAERAGIGIDWAATDKAAYLTALTRELQHPGKGQLDEYLQPFVGAAIGRDGLSGHVAGAPGLGGNPKEPLGANEVLGSFSDPALQERYRHQERQRGEVNTDDPLAAAIKEAKEGGSASETERRDPGRGR